MKIIIKLFMVFAALVLGLVIMIKVIQGCSFKEAVGILEEMWKEITEECC